MATHCHSIHNDRIKPRLEAMERIRELVEPEALATPGVVVIGSQSAGKSSLLESYSGIVLPKGSSITTRVPLVLHMSPGPDAHFEIGRAGTGNAAATMATHADLSKVPTEISRLTEQICSEGNCFVRDEPITLKVVAPELPTMVVIDLPGIAYVGNNGAEDIHKATTALISKYIRQEEIVILVVVEASADPATCEALKMAQQVDPTGTRTLVVFTKLDVMPKDIEGAVRRLTGQEIPHPAQRFISVISRSSAELQQQVSIAELRKKEAAFFQEHTARHGFLHGLPRVAMARRT